MDRETLFLVLTVVAVVVGVLLILPPTRRYWGNTALQYSGYAFLFIGAVLILNFKWAQVIVEVAGQKLEMSELRAQLEEKEIMIASLSETIGDQKITLASLQKNAEQWKKVAESKEEQAKEYLASYKRYADKWNAYATINVGEGISTWQKLSADDFVKIYQDKLDSEYPDIAEKMDSSDKEISSDLRKVFQDVFAEKKMVLFETTDIDPVEWSAEPNPMVPEIQDDDSK